MSWLRLFHRLMLRPLWRDPVRTLLTVFAVSLGVAVVVAIDLAGEASAGEFRSSMETLSGEADLEVTSTGGLDEALLADLVRLPYPLKYSARVEGFAIVKPKGEAVPVFGLDVLGDETLRGTTKSGDFAFDDIGGDDAVWVGWGLADKPGDILRLQINDTTRSYSVKGVLRGAGFQAASAENIVIMDIAAAQRVLDKPGRLTRIQIHTPDGDDRDWEALLAKALPDGVQVYPVGAKTEENRKMLGAFRWNLRVLSWISLIVGAFLIYNTISVSVVRRRVEIGVLRAMGATRSQVRWAFLAEAGFFGAAGTALGLLVGRVLASGALEMMAMTVRTLYVTGDAGAIAITPMRLLTAAAAGIGVALLSAWQPSNEAARVAPTEAMARGRHDHEARLRVGRDFGVGSGAGRGGGAGLARAAGRRQALVWVPCRGAAARGVGLGRAGGGARDDERRDALGAGAHRHRRLSGRAQCFGCAVAYVHPGRGAVNGGRHDGQRRGDGGQLSRNRDGVDGAPASSGRLHPARRRSGVGPLPHDGRVGR